MLKNLHLTLQFDLYQELKLEANEQKKPMTKVVKEFLTTWLTERKRERRLKRVHKEFAAFAQKHANSNWDIDPDVEDAGIQSFLKWERDHA